MTEVVVVTSARLSFTTLPFKGVLYHDFHNRGSQMVVIATDLLVGSVPTHFTNLCEPSFTRLSSNSLFYRISRIEFCTIFPTWKIFSDPHFFILTTLWLGKFFWHQMPLSYRKNFRRHQNFCTIFPIWKIFQTPFF